MKVEVPARRGGERSLILIPETEEESAMIDTVLGSRVRTDDGLIAGIKGEVRIADGYGPHYLTLRAEEPA